MNVWESCWRHVKLPCTVSGVTSTARRKPRLIFPFCLPFLTFAPESTPSPVKSFFWERGDVLGAAHPTLAASKSSLVKYRL